jgi:nucleoside-diphosphate-sugar epimerase
MPQTRSLVTGGAGFIGSHIVRRLLELGHEVRVIDNLITGFRHNLDEVADRIDFRVADIRDPRSCAEAVEGVDVVFHVAALPSVPRSMADPVGTHETNVNGTLNLLEAGRHAGVRRFVYSSSSSAYGDTPVLPKVESMEPLPRSPYAAAKLSGELYTLAYARAGLIEGVALRYFNVFGPRQDPNGPYAAIIPLVFRAAMTGTPVTIFGDGRQTRDFTFVENAVDANLLSAQRDATRVSGQVLNVGAGSRTSLLELIEMVQQTVGMEVNVLHAPDRPGDVRDSQAGLARAQSVLGYQPAVDVREGIRRLWAWYAANPRALEQVGPTS